METKASRYAITHIFRLIHGNLKIKYTLRHMGIFFLFKFACINIYFIIFFFLIYLSVKNCWLTVAKFGFTQLKRKSNKRNHFSNMGPQNKKWDWFNEMLKVGRP